MHRRKSSIIPSLLSLAGLGLVVSPLTHAASLYVTSTAAPNPSATCTQAVPCHLDDALNIAATNSADDEVLLVAPSTFNGIRDVRYSPALSDWDRDLSIRVSSGDGVFDGAGNSVAFWLHSRHGNITVEDIRLRDVGWQGGTLIQDFPIRITSDSGTITLRNVTVQDNIRYVSGSPNPGNAGASLTSLMGTVVVEDSTFLRNQPGALLLAGDHAILRGSSFVDNKPHFSDSNTQGAVRVLAATVQAENNSFFRNECLEADHAGALEVVFNTAFPSSPGADSQIRNNQFIDNAGERCAGAIHLERPSPAGTTFIANVAVDGNTFDGNDTVNLSGGAVRAELGKGMRLLMRSNLAINNRSLIHPPAGVVTSGAVLFAELRDNANAFVINNTILDNETGESDTHGGAVHLRALSDQNDLGVYNNILIDNPANGSSGPDSDLFIDGNTNASVSIRYNRLGSSSVFSGPLVTVSDNLLSGAPGFVNRAGGDYHLAMSSPLIDAGLDPGLSLLPVSDFDGQARVQHAAVDIGADEYSGALLRQVTVMKFGGGDGSVGSLPAGLVCGVGCSTGNGYFEEGSTIGLIALADGDSEFVGWDGDCDSVSTPGTMLTVGSSSNTCFAFFKPRPAGARVFDDGFE
ncbi:MAG: hypothetical protein KDI75_09535 [Xanthomonadales bacterium]|nr:hypothetical protein [Xanthomonadales bacterium]